MKKIVLLTAILGFISSGCLVVQSLMPFYTSDIVVDSPKEMMGRWFLVQEGKRKLDKQDISTVIFKDNKMQLKGSDVNLSFNTKFFKIGDQLFMDFILTDKPFAENNGDLLILTHSVFMLNYQTNQVNLVWLKKEWVEEQCKKRNLNFKVYEEGSHDYVITADSKDLVLLLKDLKSDPTGVSDTWILNRKRK